MSIIQVDNTLHEKETSQSQSLQVQIPPETSQMELHLDLNTKTSKTFTLILHQANHNTLNKTTGITYIDLQSQKS